MKKLSVMFFALLAAVAMSANTFTKVTSAPEDWSGQYLVVYEKSATEAWVFNGKDEAQDYVTATIADGKIVSDDLDKYAVTIEKMDGGYSVKVGAQYMGGDASNNTIKFNAQPILNTISMDSVVYFTSNTSVLRFNPTSTIQKNKETGIRYRYYKAATYTKQKGFQLYKGKVEPIITKIDTISVTEARARIDADKLDACYVRGIVATAPSDPGSYKNTIFWMTDIENPNDSLEGYKISGLNGADIPTIDDIPFGLGDTIMIFANALKLYNNSIYETESGYFFRMIGKSSTVNVTDIYKYGVGAVEIDPIKEGKYAFEIVLSSVDAEDMKNALHMVITPSMERSVEGSYSLFAENSYADNGGPISGSIRLDYKSTDGTNNIYHVVANYILNEKTYRIDGDYELIGYTKDFESFPLENDTPYEAKEGEVLTCLKALRFAKSLGGEKIESGITVSIHGYVADKPTIKSGNQVDFNIKDNADLTGIAYAKAFFCYEQEWDSILKGDEVYVTGKVQLYGGQAEISNGTITRLNEGPKHERNLPCVEIPDNYISVAKAMEIGNALQAEIGKTAETDEEYTVVGYVANVTFQMTNDTATWFMSDDKESTFGDLQAYKCHIKFMLTHGERVMVTGKIAKYQKNATTANIEFARGDAQIINPCTDLEQVFMKAESLHINKILVKGQLLFQKDNKWYNAQGAVIKE